MAGKPRVAFICGGNAARSQMAEGFLRALYGDRFEAASAGLVPSRVSRTATRVMAEAGIDITGHRSKPVTALGREPFDLVVTLSEEAARVLPSHLPPGRRFLHQGFADPAGSSGDETAILRMYRDTRDAIGAWVREEFGPGGRFADLQKT